MRYLSVFSGIEAATLAWKPLGWTPFGFAEIEKFPSAVLAHHYGSNMPGEPLSQNGVPNFGDVTKFKEWPDGPVDLICGGSPCQSFSVAGLRKGMDDPRGNLALVYLAIVNKYRPRWVVYENVPGLLSSNGGRDFGSVLGGLGELGYGWSYRVLDAQYVRVDGYDRAVPQRRRRVFVVGYLGDWRRAAAVLLEPQGMRGDTPPRRKQGQAVAGTLSASSGRRGGMPRAGIGVGAIAFAQNTRDEVRLFGGDGQSVGALSAEPGMKQTTYVANAIQAGALRENPASGPDGVGVQEGVAYTLEARAEVQAVQEAWAVRRLTPTECERLQGFPDGFTDIKPNGKPTADGPRYKALGNSMAVNAMRWIGRRIEMVEKITADQDRRAA